MHLISKLNSQKCIDTNSDTQLALLQIRILPLGPGLPSPGPLYLTAQEGL